MESEQLDRKIEEYHFVDSMLSRLKKRRDELNKTVKQALLRSHELTAEGSIVYETKGYKTTLTARRSRLDIDEYTLQDYLIANNLWEICKKEIVDRDVVKQLYINGMIPDRDLRALIEHKDPQAALTVEATDV